MDGPMIEAHGLRKSYGGEEVLRGVDLTVAAGEILALLGPNGAGKTTTVRILSTLTAADGGRARVAGADVATERHLVRRSIALTGQYAALDEAQTGRENLEMMARLNGRPAAAARRRAAELLDRFDLTAAARRRVSTYSGGMRRRLDLAASLVGRPVVIFLDEPTTGLDPRSRQDLWTVVADLAREGTTVFLTTQYLDEADELADEIAILHGGRIVAGGTPDELKAMVPTGVVELEFGEEAQLTAAERALERRHEVSRVDAKLVVATTGSVAEIADIFIQLKDGGIEPTGFSRQLPTLDDVFFKVLDQDKEERYASAR
jgi:ABC-2 type transport system ATP-binding protein